MDNGHHANTGSDLDAEYGTDNLDLGAYLLCRGLSLRRLEPPAPTADRPHARFIFPRTQELTDALTDWESGQPLRGIDLRRYLSVKKDLYRRARRVVSRKGGQQ